MTVGNKAWHSHAGVGFALKKYAKNKLSVCNYLKAALWCDLCTENWYFGPELFPSVAACSNLIYMGGKPPKQIFDCVPILKWIYLYGLIWLKWAVIKF